MTFAESWTGTKWAVEKTPTPTGGNPSDPELTSVSCTSVHDCTSVGDYIGSSGAGVTLAESWNGLAWTIEKTPSPPGPQQVSTLSGVSCTTSCGCVAVGATDDGNGATNAPMIESTF
jgi:hypothetical protein